MTREEIYLGLAALVLVVFSLVVSMVVPRRNPDFPGRNLRLFTIVSVVLVIVMLAAVEMFGAEEGHGEGGEGGGAASLGRQVFDEQKCAGCHTLAAADADGSVGPNLDEALKGEDANFVEESIVEPDAHVHEGFSPDLMPEDYGEKLSHEELDALVAFLVESTRGS